MLKASVIIPLKENSKSIDTPPYILSIIILKSENAKIMPKERKNINIIGCKNSKPVGS